MRLSRRNLVRGLGLGAVLWPVLASRRVGACPDDGPRRVVVVFSPNGPTMLAGPTQGTELAFELRDFWTPLERHKSKGLFFRNVHQAGVPFGEHNEYGHQSGGTGALTARTTEGTNHATGPSLDQFIGQGLEASGVILPKRSLLWGLHGEVGNWGPWYESAGVSISPISDPYAALDDLSLSLGGTRMNPQLLRKRFILDQITADCAALRSELGAEGREVLDLHCANIESLEASVTASLGRPVSCESPESLGIGLPRGTNFGQQSTRDEAMRGFAELMALSFTCDLTRVIGISFGRTAERFAIPESYGIPSSATVDSGDSGPQHHAWTHVYEPTPDKEVALRGFYHWYSEQVALLIDKLETTLDVDGRPLLDTTLVLWTSELGGNDGSIDGHPNYNIPVMLFGSSCGAFRTGRHFQASGNNQSRAMPLHQLYVSIARHAGLVSVDRFGNAGDGPLEWLEG